MVAFASSGRYQRAPIAEGTAVRGRQKILTLPNLTHMQVKTAIHESVLDQIKPGLPVTVCVDAFPDRRFTGSVASVAVLPDQSGWMSSDTKVYETIVTIDEEVEQLKPGMTAVVEIHVVRLEDVLVVPVQAIVQIQSESWCYVDIDGQVEKRILTLGRTNDKFVVLREGINEGDRVVLNPSAIVEQSEEGEPSSSLQEETEDTLPDDPPESSPS